MSKWILTGIVVLLLMSGPHAVFGEQCRTVTLPTSEGGGAVTIQPGGLQIVVYPYPSGATRVGLEFWSHAFPGGAPVNTQYLLVYLNDAQHGGRRIFHAWNAGPEHGTGLSVNFPLSIHMHPDETLIVGWLNNTEVWQSGYLILTLRECWP